jgi:hypothetical protein
VLVAYVESLEILAHHDEIDVVESAARHERACGPQIRIQLELFAQANIRGTVATSRGSLERPLESKPGAADAIDGLWRQWIAGALDALEARHLPIPLKRGAERVEHR